MPIKLKNPFRKTHKKRKASPPKLKKLFSSAERERIEYLKTLIEKENKAADIKLGKALKDSFEKYLGTKSKSKSKRKSKRKGKRKGKGKTSKK